MELCIATIDSIKQIEQLGAIRLNGTSIFNKTIFVSYICIFPGVYNYNMPCSVQLLHYEHYDHCEQDTGPGSATETQLRPAEEVTTLHCGQLAGHKRINRGASKDCTFKLLFWMRLHIFLLVWLILLRLRPPQIGGCHSHAHL